MVSIFDPGVDTGGKDSGHHAEGDGFCKFPVFWQAQALLAIEFKKLLNEVRGGTGVVHVAVIPLLVKQMFHHILDGTSGKHVVRAKNSTILDAKRR